MSEEQKFSVTMRPLKPIGTNLGDVKIEVLATSQVKALIKARDIAYEKYPELKGSAMNFLGVEPMH